MTFDEIRKKVKVFTLVDDNRLRVLYEKSKETENISGVMAEIGAYRGGSALLIAESVPNKKLYVCDSFEGLPQENPEIDTHHKKGDFNDTSFEKVKSLLKSYSITVIKGFFPDKEIHKEMLSQEYSFVHIDVDLYKPTLDCLEFFYPRMTSGAILVSDDYLTQSCPGVKRAFDEFMLGKPELLVDTGKKSCYFKKI